MNPLLIVTPFPRQAHDNTVARAHILAHGELPPLQGVPRDIEIEVRMLYALHLLTTPERQGEAPAVIDMLLFNDTYAAALPPLYSSWLWVARMNQSIASDDYMLALGAAENALNHLATITAKKQEDFLALLASLLYDLARVHSALGDNSRAAKELTKAQKLFERLVKKNERRFSPMLLVAVEASTSIITSRNQQMEILAHYHSLTEQFTEQLQAPGDENMARQALEQLIDTLSKEGEIMLQMGNARNAMKYYTKALRYQKRLSDNMGMRELTLSIGLAKALNRIHERRAAAEQLLTSLLPLARKLGAAGEAIEIENMLNNRNKNGNIMTLLKSIF